MLHVIPKTPIRRCAECGETIGPKKLYCSPAHRLAFHNRMSKRGRVALPLALGWRMKRGSGDTAKRAFAEFCAYLDRCNAEDREAGRPPMVDHLSAMFAWGGGGLRWNDR